MKVLVSEVLETSVLGRASIPSSWGLPRTPGCTSLEVLCHSEVTLHLFQYFLGQLLGIQLGVAILLGLYGVVCFIVGLV